MKYYFTYGSGSEKQPYAGGWTEVEARNLAQAVEVFCLVHPKKDGLVPCASWYPEEEFKKTKMWKHRDNFGHGRRELIELKVTIEDPTK